MADKILLKRADTPGKVPLAADLDLGELALNTADGTVYLKKADGSVVAVGGGGTGGAQEVGDVIVTTRTMGSGYLPCDASIYLQSTHPDLFPKVGVLPDYQRGNITSVNTLPLLVTWSSIAYGDGLFVAVGSNNTAMAATSPDGVSWTVVTLPVAANWESVTHGDGLFVAVARNSAVAATSPDGVNWTQRNLPSSDTWAKVVHGNNLFVAFVSSSTKIATSPDGVTWTQRALPSAAASPPAACYGAGLFVCSTSLDPYTSPDGVTWTRRPLALPSASLWIGLTYGGGLFMGVEGVNPGTYFTSRDGIRWQRSPTPPWVSPATGVTHGGGVFVIQSGNAVANRVIAVSTDGLTWSTRYLSVDGNWAVAAFGGGKFVFTRKMQAQIAEVWDLVPYDRTTQFMVPRLDPGYGLTAYIKASN